MNALLMFIVDIKQNELFEKDLGLEIKNAKKDLIRADMRDSCGSSEKDEPPHACIGGSAHATRKRVQPVT